MLSVRFVQVIVTGQSMSIVPTDLRTMKKRRKEPLMIWKKQYEEAVEGMTTAESMIKNMEGHLQFMYDKVLEMIGTIQKSLSRLDKIALKPNPLTEVQYIELLADSIQERPGQTRLGAMCRVL